MLGRIRHSLHARQETGQQSTSRPMAQVPHAVDSFVGGAPPLPHRKRSIASPSVPKRKPPPALRAGGGAWVHTRLSLMAANAAFSRAQ